MKKRMMKKKEIEELRFLIQTKQDTWTEFDKGFYFALCKVLQDRK